MRAWLVRYHKLFGLRGVLGASAHRFFRRPAEIRVRPPGTDKALYLRLGTSDEMVYCDTLLTPQYAFDLPFVPNTIIDAGANIGTASIFFARRYPQAKVIALEPEPSNFALLTRNIKPYPTITAIHAALWNHDGEVSIRAPDPATGASGNWAFAVEEGHDFAVPAITLRTLMEETHTPSVDVLKMDIEGAEKEVFEACDWIDGVRCLMIELHDRFKPGCSEAVNRVMRGFSQSKRGEVTLYLRAR